MPQKSVFYPLCKEAEENISCHLLFIQCLRSKAQGWKLRGVFPSFCESTVLLWDKR